MSLKGRNKYTVTIACGQQQEQQDDFLAAAHQLAQQPAGNIAEHSPAKSLHHRFTGHYRRIQLNAFAKLRET